MASISAKNVRVRINGAIHRIDTLEITDEAGELDTTDSESGGWGEVEDTGIQDSYVTFDGNYNVGGAPLVNFYPGALLTNVIVYLGTTLAEPKYTYAAFRVLSARVSSQTRGGKVRIQLRGKNHGIYTRPTT